MYSLVPVWYTKCVFIQKGKTCLLFVERLHTQLRLETSDRQEGWVSIHKRFGLTSVLHEREKYPSTSISDGTFKSLAPLPFRMPSLRLVKELPPSQRNGGTHPTILSKTSNPLIRPVRPRRSISPRPWFLLPVEIPEYQQHPCTRVGWFSQRSGPLCEHAAGVTRASVVEPTHGWH